MSRDLGDHIPSFLRTWSREEEAEEDSTLESVWRLLGVVAWEELSEDADVEEAWSTVRSRCPGLDRETSGRPTSANSDSTPSSPFSEGDAPSKRSPEKRSPVRRDRGQPWRWIVGGGVVAVVVVMLGIFWSRQSSTVTASPGEQRTVELSDGSTVELNSGSELTYRRNFTTLPFVDASQRTVRLEGEAFFDIAAGSQSFVVNTFNARITVAGTQFNVRAWSESTTTEVILAEGEVHLAPRDQSDRAVVLDEHGLGSRVTGRTASPSAPQSMALEPVVAWRENGFAATDEPLSQVIRDLERRYDVSIQLHKTVARTNQSVSLYYATPTELENVLRDVCTALDLQYRSVDDGFTIYSEKVDS